MSMESRELPAKDEPIACRDEHDDNIISILTDAVQTTNETTAITLERVNLDVFKHLCSFLSKENCCTLAQTSKTMSKHIHYVCGTNNFHTFLEDRRLAISFPRTKNHPIIHLAACIFLMVVTLIFYVMAKYLNGIFLFAAIALTCASIVSILSLFLVVRLGIHWNEIHLIAGEKKYCKFLGNKKFPLDLSDK